MADVSATLADYLAWCRERRPFDCGEFMANWVIRLTGRDPIADVRGTYSDFDAILAREGGLRRSVGERLKRVGGWERTFKPAAGDIAVVLAPGPDGNRRPTGAIVVNDQLRAVITSDAGIVISNDERLMAIRAWTHG